MKDQIEETKQMLLESCREYSFLVTADERVGETEAAVLLGYAAETLRNMRSLGTGPAHYKRGVGGGRASYRLSDLAEWIEQAREGTLWTQ